MKIKLRSRDLFFVFGALISLGTLVLIASRSVTKHLGEHIAVLDALRFSRELNSTLNEDVLRSRSFILEDYDPIVSTTVRLRHSCTQLTASNSPLILKNHHELTSAVQAYCEAVVAKTDAVEKFKSKNSILRNSLKYLPSLTEEFHGTRFEVEARSILHETLRFNLSPDAELEADIRERIRLLRKVKHGRLKDKIENLRHHAEMTLSATRDRRAIETVILSRSADEYLADVQKKYDAWYSQESRTGTRYQIALTMISIGLFISVLLIFQKLVAQKENLRGLNASLEDRVEERTQALSNALEQLEEKQQQLVQTAKMGALGEMAGGIAHEINTPLGVILMSTDMLRNAIRDGNEAEIEEELGTITSIVERISKIILGLKRFARNSSNDEMRVVSTSEIIADTLTLCNEKFIGNSVLLKVEDRAKDSLVFCVPEQLVQVLLNLLSNSFDAVQDMKTSREKWVEIGTSVVDDKVELWVRDCGEGIPNVVLTKLMQPFFTTKPVGKGTGLGLSISRGIVKAHEGDLYYDRNSKNTRFVISLPRVALEAVA